MLKILNPLIEPPKLPPNKAKKLTDGFIAKLKPAPKGNRYAINDFGDGMVSGLKVRVTDKGTKSFILWRRYNSSKNPAARSLGTVGAITLAEAREKARAWIKLIKRGDDPRAVERRARDANQESNAITFEKVFEEYLAKHVKGQRRAKDAEREMRKDLLSRWKDKPLHEISRRDVIRMIDAVKERGPAQAHNVLGHAKTFFNWVIERNIYGIEFSPADKIRPGRLIGKKVSRQRVLDDREIKEFWRAAGRLGYPFGTLFQLLLMTGQRRSEIAEASRHEIKKRILTIPEERFKSGFDQIVPLTNEMMALLDTIPLWNGGDFLFSTTHGTTAVNGFSFQKRKLDNIMTGALGDFEMKPWVLHDLRRTVRTRLASLKVRDEVAEMIIGHGRKGMQRVYDQHQYVDEMREALEAWNARLREIVS
jgi:integrase